MLGVLDRRAVRSPKVVSHPEDGLLTGKGSLGPRKRDLVLAAREKALEHLAVAGRILHELEARLTQQLHEAGRQVPRAELAALIRTLAGDSIPPWRPVW